MTVLMWADAAAAELTEVLLAWQRQRQRPEAARLLKQS